jgi:hypothetical protein
MSRTSGRKGGTLAASQTRLNGQGISPAAFEMRARRDIAETWNHPSRLNLSWGNFATVFPRNVFFDNVITIHDYDPWWSLLDWTFPVAKQLIAYAMEREREWTCARPESDRANTLDRGIRHDVNSCGSFIPLDSEATGLSARISGILRSIRDTKRDSRARIS